MEQGYGIGRVTQAHIGGPIPTSIAAMGMGCFCHKMLPFEPNKIIPIHSLKHESWKDGVINLEWTKIY